MPELGEEGRLRVSSGSPYEATAGYCRALRVGNLVYVAGTASYKDGEVFAAHDAVSQTRHILSIIATALTEAGSSLNDVVRYRVYLTEIRAAAGVVAEMSRVFAEIRPVSTLIGVSALVDPALVVEIEVDAVIGDGYGTSEA
jgi:enamine deaminase RidA (YjgF/YER057c/UK114 family)